MEESKSVKPTQTDDADRQGPDRREKPTPMFSRYTLFGRRRNHRRDADGTERYYVDWVDGRYRSLVISVTCFILVDAMATLTIIEKGGGEANLLMAWVLEHGVGWFLFVKTLSAIVGLVVLAVHRHFPLIRSLAKLLLIVYGGVVIYHIYLLSRIFLEG